MTLHPIFYLIGMHLLTDWGLQSQFMALTKHKNKVVMLAHVSLWTIGICIVLDYLKLLAWWKPVMLFAGHWAEDYWTSKRRAAYPTFEEASDNGKGIGADRKLFEEYRDNLFEKWLMNDQIFHLVQILICYFL